MSQAEDEAFAETIDDQLTAIEQRLDEVALGADNPFLAEAAQHVISAGGKRFRPLLVALTSHLGPSAEPEDVTRAAIVVELTHVASLYHDDVMDEADLRRGVPSANAAFGNSTAIMVGDWLFARASTEVTHLGTDYVRLQAETFADLVTGQIGEMKGPPPGADPMTHYLRVIEGKTGALIRTSALFGAMVCGADQRVIDAIGRYGMQIGLVFQLSDDLIDVTSDETGKTPGTDLREGVLTLPTLLLAASDAPADRDLMALIRTGLDDDADLARALAALRANHVIDEARAEIRRRSDLARAELAVLPDGPARRALDRLCDEVITRSA
ncbi:Isoprenoid Synthase Type I [Propionibacterium ruminifibrarum]|uniref:Isoprenoid Synthase Type I n=1 Tax=Propionibacterium ruminifibrarum TaxID=1962131 RepID=A0A375I5Y9_9ACTN|nr:Isoprenoid Synthase Type I [Propionibacterium ruminifibrarum]